MPVDYDGAKELLAESFRDVEAILVEGKSAFPSDAAVDPDLTTLFDSKSQSIREALLGCALVRCLDPEIDVRRPYVAQGPASISLRTFDENVVNPFLHDRQIPCSRGPYLEAIRKGVRPPRNWPDFDSVWGIYIRAGKGSDPFSDSLLAMFRRGFEFTRDYDAKVRDAAALEAFLNALDHLERLSQPKRLAEFLRTILARFWILREDSSVSLMQLKRLSLRQYDRLIESLLDTPSGGRFPLLLVAAAFHAITQSFQLEWRIAVQGINVSDAAAGSGGDITVYRGDEIALAVEVTERDVDRARLVATFRSKIASRGIADYLFLTRHRELAPEAASLIEQFFSQGHEVNVLEIRNWLVATLATVGSKGRAAFNLRVQQDLAATEIPKAMKVAWNANVSQLVS